MKYLFIGLGNVGAEYEHTRHNIGFDVLDELAEQRKLTFDAVKHGVMAIDKYAGKQCYLLKPNTFMNLSGRAFNYWMNELSIP